MKEGELELHYRQSTMDLEDSKESTESVDIMKNVYIYVYIQKHERGKKKLHTN